MEVTREQFRRFQRSVVLAAGLKGDVLGVGFGAATAGSEGVRRQPGAAGPSTNAELYPEPNDARNRRAIGDGIGGGIDANTDRLEAVGWSAMRRGTGPRLPRSRPHP
ncbi:MAG: hypothetical protein ER33_04215 [Cyanobium sp. CACIAM 14]|nr:MAG: hypothetical protein ER33_04215 [Cyanobium sp. CACIAM 14]